MDLFAVPDEVKTAVRRLFRVSESDICEKVAELKTWTEKHPHLPIECQNEDFLHVILLRNKFDVERTKNAVLKYFRCLVKYKEYFGNLGRHRPSQEVGVIVACPNLSETYERIGVMRLSKNLLDPRDFDIDRCILTAATAGILMVNLDYVYSVRVVIDFEDVTMKHILKITPSAVLKLVNIHENVLKVRLSGIEILNAPGILNAVLSLAKMLLKPKVFSRISVHDNLESLHKNIDRACLPCDYGGHLESIDALTRVMDKAVTDNRALYDQIEKIVQTSDLTDDNLGIQGTFRKLTID